LRSAIACCGSTPRDSLSRGGCRTAKEPL
jgi:hypothetical protein